MTGIVSVPYNARVLNDARRRHDEFVDAQAARLGVEPAAILAAVRDFGLTASDIGKLADKSGLTRYPGSGEPIVFKVLAEAPIPVPRIKNPKPQAKLKKKARPGQAMRKRAKAHGRGIGGQLQWLRR